MTLRTLAFVATVAMLAFAGVSSAATKAQHRTQTVAVTMTEFRFVFTPKTVHPGTVSFRLANKGKLVHDLLIAGKRSALIGPGKTGALTVTLHKGRYPYRCTVPGHADAGMKGTLVVR